MLNKCRRILHSCKILGIKQTAFIIQHRLQSDHFAKQMRSTAEAHTAGHTWQHLAPLLDSTFATFWLQIQKRSLPFIDSFYADMASTELQIVAQRYAQHRFQALGSDWYQLDEQMWHTDIRLKQQGGSDYLFALLYFKDIKILNNKARALKKDIKVPWELSRLQHLPLLAQAYKHTEDKAYFKAFVYQVEHWMKHNPYLMGVNWLCPMEVAIRAINLIIACDGFKNAEISDAFWKRYCALLYDHMHYLEHNWEWYDGRTSNHYLSNLVGYLYLCWFFQDFKSMAKKTAWCIKEILRECDKQVFAEGTSYEGSTRYHVLVTELFYHFCLLCDQMGVILPSRFYKKLARMCSFIDQCRINDKYMISIGDHDSGKILWPGLPNNVIQAMKLPSEQVVSHFNAFGLSIIRTKQWHVSLRHHAYNKNQPSGHFHNDVGSITLAIDSIPVLIDPGSYVYTASMHWRNWFRSAGAHNTINIKGHEPVPFDERAFFLALPERVVSCEKDTYILTTSHTLYERLGLRFLREVTLQNNALVIHDTCNRSESSNLDLCLRWNFTFSTEIDLKKQKDIWLGFYKHKLLFTFESQLPFFKTRGWVSYAYGSKENTWCLQAEAPLIEAIQIISCLKRVP